MALWIIFVPLILFINSFLLGKVYKRFNHQLNSYLTTLLGFFSFFGTLSLIFAVLILFNITLQILFYIFLIFQIILFIIYIFNWRWSFITYNINFKKMGFLIFLIIICFLAYVLSRNFNSDHINWYLSDGINFKSYYLKSFFNIEPQNIYIFRFGTNYLDNNFIYVVYSVIVYLFNVSINDLELFYTIINCSIMFFCLSLIIVHLSKYLDEKKSLWTIFLSSSVIFMIAIISFWMQSLFWISVFSLSLIVIHTSKQNEINSQASISIINFIVASGVFFNIQFLLIAITINLIQLFISYKTRKVNATDYNVLMLFSTLLYTGLIFDNSKYISFILIISILVFYSFYIFYKSSTTASRINQKIDHFLYKNINLISIIFLILILILSVALFLSTKNFQIFVDPWVIAILSTNSNSIVMSWVVNVFFWMTNIILLLFVLFSNSLVRFKKISYSYYPETDLSMMIFIAFWNPISINLFSSINNVDFIYMQPDFQVLFFIILCALIINQFKKIKINNIWSPIIHGAWFLTSSIIIITSINLGVING